jgi:hypothetical protein
MSLFGWLFVLGLAGVLVLIGLRLLPLYSEYWTVVQVAEQVRGLPDISSKTKSDIRKLIGARFGTNNIRSLNPDVIKIERDKSKALKLTIDYEDRRHMIANLDVVAKFNRVVGSSP